MFEQIIVQTVNGLVNGMVLALVASGLTLIFASWTWSTSPTATS